MAELQSSEWKYNILYLCMYCCLGMSVFIASASGSNVKYCYYGRDVNSLEMLLNETCETRETHLAQSILAIDSIRDSISDSPKMTINSSMASPDGANCFIFRHVSTKNLHSGMKKESIHTSFSCDFDSMCVGKAADTVLRGIKYRGNVGELYCCSTDNCNSIEKMPHSPAENRICYSGSSNSSQVGFESCEHPDVFCVTITHILNDTKYETFSCDKHDEQRHCDSSISNGAYRYCDKRTVKGVFQEVCCCDSNRCNEPSNPKLLTPEKDSSTLYGGKKKIITPIKNPQSKKENDKVITGLVAAVVLLVFACITVLLFTAYKNRKRRSPKHRDPNVIMQYERLSSSEQDLEEPVVV